MRGIGFAAATLLAGAGTAFGQWSDDFNRPNGPMGPDWNTVAGVFGINNNQGMSQGGGNQWMQHTSASAAYDSVTMSVDAIALGTTLQYVALMSGVGGADNLYIKIQQQDGSGMFHTCGIYHGFNGGGWPGQVPVPPVTGAFFAMQQPFAAARMTVTISNNGDTLTLDLDTDFNGTPDQSYSVNGVNVISGSFGQGFGIGGFGVSVFDNWQVGTGTPPCYPDCNGDGALNLADFGCFQTRFALGDPYADCNGDGVINLADFGCFQTQFALGCP